MKQTIKKLAIAGLLLLCNLGSEAQGVLDVYKAHQNYWNYRNRFKTMFTKIGIQNGNSIPLAERWDDIRGRDKDEDNMGNPFCDSAAGKIGCGDGLSFLGYYLSVMATEYKLLKDAGQPTQATLNELYYAINALNRIDLNAEKFWGLVADSSSINGFLTRDDFDSSSHLAWKNQLNTTMTGTDNYGKMIFDEATNTCPEKKTAFDGTDINGNVMSQDHLINILMGFSFIKKYVPNVHVKPTSADRGFNIIDEIVTITRRLMDNVTATKALPYTGSCLGDPFQGQEIFNWAIVNPLTGNRISFEKGTELGPLCWAFAKGAERVTGSDDYYINAVYKRKVNNSLFCSGPQIGITVGRSENLFKAIPSLSNELRNNNFTLNYPKIKLNGSTFNIEYVSKSLSDIYEEIADNESILNNMNMVFTLAVITHAWDKYDFQRIAYDFHLPFYELMNAVLNDETSVFGKFYWEDFIASVPTLHNPTRLNQDSIWLHSISFTHLNRHKLDESKGYFSGLDYMLLYNLYHIQYSPNTINYSESSCDCATDSAFIFPYIENDTLKWEERYRWIGSAVSPKDIISPQVVNINRFHPDYLEKGIATLNYFSAFDYTVNTGQVNVKGDAIICNRKSVTVFNTGQLNIGGTVNEEVSTFRVKDSTSLILATDGILTINNNSRVIIEVGGTLKIEGMPTINLNGSNAILEIRGNLELLPNSVFKPMGSGYVLFNIPIVNNNNLPNITVNGNNCQMLFEDLAGTKRIEIANNTRLHPPKNLKLFKIEGITAELGLNASMVLPCDFHIVNNTITRIPNVTDNNGNTRIHKGITIYGILHPQYITDNTFSDAKTAFTILNPQGHYDIKIHYNDFINCDYGVQVRNGRTHVFANEFIDCGQAVQAIDFARTLRFESNTIKGAGNNPTGFGFEITSANYADVGVTGNVFSKTVTGFHGDKAVATLACNHFFQNEQAIDFYNYGSLNISAAIPSTGISLVGGSPLNGGYNYLNIPSGKNGAKVTSPYGLLRPFFLTTHLDNGYNSFYNVGSSNPQHSSLVITRPSNTLNASIQDLTINNNYWGPQANVAYVTPPLPPNFISVNNAGSIHFAINENYTPRYILGVQSATTTTCPISAWTSALSDPLNFDPDTKKPPVGGGATLNIYRNGSVLSSFDGNFGGISTTENVPNGTYMGTNVKTAFRNVFTGFTETVPLSVGGSEERVLKQGILNLANLLTATSSLISPEAKEMNVFGYQKYLASIGDAIGAQVFVGDATGVANQLLAANALFDQLNTVNDLVNTNDTPHYRVKFNIELDRMIVHWMFGKYADALEINSDISTFVQTDDIDRLNYWNCIIENERKVIAEEITELEYAENIKTCAMLFPYQPLQGNGQNGGSQGSGGGSNDPSVTYTLTPNPATDIITVNMDLSVDGDVKIAVFNKFGSKVVSDIPLGELLAGNHSHTVAIAGLPVDVYNMVVYVDNVPFVEHFIKNNE